MSTTCTPCNGTGVVGAIDLGEICTLSWCPRCRCQICGQPTDTPPECGPCAIGEETLAKRRADRYE